MAAGYRMRLLVSLICTLGVVSHALPQVPVGADSFDHDDTEADVPGPPLTDAELEASLLDDSLLEPPPEDSPLTTQSQLFQGDIILESEDELSETILNNQTLVQNDAIANANKKWPGAAMPYVISSAFGSRDRGVIARAFAEIRKRTCIKLMPRTKQSDYIHIKKRDGCFSYIGRVKGSQTVSLGTGCVYFGIVLHELMHAAGFWHEQSRYDRDNHVTINWDNIKSGFRGNFEKLTKSVTKDLGLPYDYSSVMHYGKYAFAINPQVQTIYSKQSGKEILGQRKGFSELDVKGLNLLYECGGEPVTPKPSGCADANVQCSGWAKEGECAKNPTYMHEHCKKSCKTCAPIPISKIVDHGGIRPGGAGPENLLQTGGFWNPNPKPWFVVFDLGRSHAVTSLLVTNFGDTTHDMTAFKLEVSEDLKSWTKVKTVNNVATGTGKDQTFRLSGTGRYWRFTVTATAKGFQPYLKRVAFFGLPSTGVRSSLISLSASSIVKHGGFRPGGAGPEKLLQTAGYWNPNPKPWFVVFNLGRSHVVTSFQATNFGDTTHDMTAFKLEASEDLESWTRVKTIENVETGTGKIQTFKLSGTGRYWRFTVTATAEGFQPYLKRVAFFGYPIQCWSESTVPCGSSDVPEGKNFPHPEYCNKFIKCSGGSATVKTCSKGKIFNHHNGFCSKTANFCFCGTNTT